MNSSKYRSVPKGAGKKVAELFKKSRKQEPSDRLIKIISEVGQEIQDQSETPSKPNDRVARLPDTEV